MHEHGHKHMRNRRFFLSFFRLFLWDSHFENWFVYAKLNLPIEKLTKRIFIILMFMYLFRCDTRCTLVSVFPVSFSRSMKPAAAMTFKIIFPSLLFFFAKKGFLSNWNLSNRNLRCDQPKGTTRFSPSLGLLSVERSHFLK